MIDVGFSTTTRGRRGAANLMASLLMATTALGAGAIVATPALAQEARSYDIPAGPLPDVLNAYARQAGVELAYRADLTANASSAGLKGSYGPAEGLSRILAGTGVTYRQTGPRAFTLEPAPSADASAVQLGPVRVEGGSDNQRRFNASSAVTEDTGSYAVANVSIAKGGPRSLREIPQSISVITQQQIKDQGLASVADALIQTPGLYLNSIDTDVAGFRSRGYDVEFSYDGTSLSVGGGLNFGRSAQDDLAFADRVEVLRGPAALLRGGSQEPGFGGMANIVRKRPKKEFAASGEIMVGSWNSYSGHFDISVPLNATGTVRARAVVSAGDQDYFYDNAHQRRYGVYGIVEADLTPDTLLTLSATYQDHDKNGNSAGLTRNADGSLISSDRSASIGDTWTGYHRKTAKIFVEMQQNISAEWILKASGNYQQENLNNPALYPVSDVDSQGNTSFVAYIYDKNDVSSTGFDINLSGSVHLFGRSHKLMIGIDGSGYDDNGFAGEGGFFADRNAFSPNIAYPFGALDRFRWKFTQYSAYASAQIKLLDPLTVIVGARSLLKLRYRTVDYPSYYTQVANLNTSGETTPYGGIIWDLSGNVTLYGSYAEQFVPQVLQSSSGVLPPRTGKQYEVGIKGAFFDNQLNGSLALYRIREVNRPFFDNQNTGCLPFGSCYVAAGLVQSQGVDVEISGSPFAGLQLTGGYTYNENKYLAGSASTIGQQFRGQTPRHLYKLWATYRLSGQGDDVNARGWTIGGGVVGQSETYVNTVIRQGGYAVFSGMIGYRINAGTSIMLNVDNVLDRHYLQSIGTFNENYYGTPRNARLTLRAGF